MRSLLAVLALAPSLAVADERGAFCEMTPCVPGPVTREKLDTDKVVGKLTCKKGEEIGLDKQLRVVFCTTAKAVVVDGIPVAKDAYTLFHPSGRIYQTHASGNFDRTLADGSKVTCGKELFVLLDDGTLNYCKLGAKRAGTPSPRVGSGIAFHRDGRVHGMTLDAPYTVAGLTLAAGSSVSWDAKGTFVGGHTRDPITLGSLTIRSDFELHPNGKPKVVMLGAPAKISGHDFPDFAKLAFRADGTLEATEYVAKRGFMIHGEPWTDTRHMQFDRTGKITGDRTEHYQAQDSPDSFRRKRNLKP